MLPWCATMRQPCGVLWYTLGTVTWATRVPMSASTSTRSSTLCIALVSDSTLCTRPGVMRTTPLLNMAAYAARIAAGPIRRVLPGWMQTMSSSSAQQAIIASRSPCCMAS